MISKESLIENIIHYTAMIEASARIIKANINGCDHPRVRNEIEEHVKKLKQYIKKLAGEWEFLKIVEKNER